MIFSVFVLAGCKRRTPPDVAADVPVVITNRMDDATYRERLKESRREQSRLAGERSEITAEMQAIIKRVQVTLSEGADEAAVKIALAKDPAWQRLEALNQAKIKEIEAALAKAREEVRQGILAEQRAQRAVAEGKARPAATQPQRLPQTGN